MRKKWVMGFLALLWVVVLFQSKATFAGPFTDELSKCILESTSKKDRIALVRWMFAAASVHPAVKPLSSVTEEQLEEANKQTADLFMRLLTESCRQQTKKALRYDGDAALRTSFHTLGTVAGQDLFSDPTVAAGLDGLKRHLDEEKLRQLKSTE